MAAASLPAAIAPVAQATAPTSAYAIIGAITMPASTDQVAVDLDDDTVYAGSYGASSLSTIVPGTTSGTPVTTIALPGRPGGVVVDSDDDSVYVWSGWPTQNLWVTSAGQSPVTSIPLGMSLQALAVNSADDTIYGTVAYAFGDDSFIAINGASTDDSTRRQGIGWGTYSLGVDEQDDTVWIAGMNSNSVRMVNGSTLQVTSVPGTFGQPRDLVVDSLNHLAYVGLTVGSLPTLAKVSPSGEVAAWSEPTATGTLMALSLNSTGSRAVFKTGNNDDSLWILDTATMQPEAPGLTIPGINETAQAASGLIYVAPYVGNQIFVVAKVQATLSSTSSRPGDTLTISVSPMPATAAGHPVTVDDSTISSVSFGGFSTSTVPAGVNSFAVTVPSGLTGQVEAVATLAGGATLSLGTVDFGGDAPPAPTPATAPMDVAAVAGDASASVTWSAPASAGSYPVTNYQVTSSPGGRVCLTSGLSCEVSRLTNGTAYTFTVKALTGAGWSPASEPSNAVTPIATPRPTITITGSREGKRIAVAGSTTGMDLGGLVTPWASRGARSAAPGKSVEVSIDGGFTWSRVASARTTWSVYFTASDGIRSNTVRFAAR